MPRNGVQRETSEYLISWRPALALGKSAMRCSVCAAEFSVITGPQRLDTSANSDAFRNSEVVVVLKVEPKLCRQAEILSQAYRGVGADGSPACYNLMNPQHTQLLRDGIHAEP